MARLPVYLMSVALCAVGVATASSVVTKAQQSQATVWTGVYTATQAVQGKALFERSCSRCHNLDLSGSDRGPSLTGDTFLSHWEDDTLDPLFSKMRDTMPQGGQGTVADEDMIMILSYILQRNGFPAGTKEIKFTENALADIRLVKKGIWDGVFTAAQAERGKQAALTSRCLGCHGPELAGDRGPALKGDNFWANWGNGNLNTLFVKIRDTMPPNNAAQIAVETKLDILAFLLQSNGLPAGAEELASNQPLMERIQIAKQGAEVAAAPNFSLVQIVGCLTQGPNNVWTLTNTSEPVVIKDEQPTAASLRDATNKRLGSQTYRLVSVASSFKADTHKGQKMEARGLLYREGGDNRINLTSLQTAGAACN